MSSILGSFIAGQQAGQQQHKYRQEQSKVAQLRELAPQVLAGNPEAYGQSMALDSAHTGRLQDGRNKQLGQLEGMVKFVDAARATNDPRQLAGAMRTIAPFMKTLTGQDIDPDAPWTPEYDTGWEAFKAQIAGARAGGTGDTLQSQKVGDDGFIYNTFRDGRMVNTGVRADRQMWFRDHPGMDPQLVGKDGSVQTVGLAQSGTAMAPAAAVQPQRADMEADIELANSMIAAGIPEAQVDAFLAQRGQRASAAAPAPAGYGAPAGGSLARPSAAQEAAATEAARQQVQLQYLPQELAARGQAAVDQAVGVERGKAGVERDQMAATRQRDAGTALELLGEAERLLPQATGGRIGAVGDAVAGAFGVSTDGARANAALATIAGQLTSKMPRMEGPQSDRDVQMYKEMAGDLANANLPIETRLAALQQIRRLQSKYAGGQPQQPQQRPVMVNSPAEYNALPAGALYTAPDGSTRRKK